MAQTEGQPGKSWRWVRISAALLLSIIAGGIITISAGLFDPKPLGELSHVYPLDLMTVDAGSSKINWLDEPLVIGASTFRLTMAYEGGELDSGVGLAIGDNLDRVSIAISPVGYLTIQRWSENDAGRIEIEQILPWQPWPHVRDGNSENEIWVDIEDGFLTNIRINRELLWQEKIPFKGDQVGLTTQSFGNKASFNFIALEHYLVGQ